jgi:pterin-4a-carbinolamine dehydratase
MEDLKILTPEEINKSLGQIPGWKYIDDKISKEFVFSDS